MKIERRGAVAVVHLDDGKANALSFDLIEQIDRALDSAEADVDVNAVVIHGRPGRFCGGFDLGVIGGGDSDTIIRLVADGGGLIARLYGSSIPVVAACTGHALAAGALLLLGCDVRVGADSDVKVGLNEIAIKMVLPDWAFTIAEARLSKRHVQRAVVNARITAPAEAVDVGYLDEVVPPEQVLDRAVEIAAELAATLDGVAYTRTVEKFRADTLSAMTAQITASRAAIDRPRSRR